MCQAYGYAVKLREIFNDVTSDYNRLLLEIGKCDLKQQDILHKIENSNFNASQGYNLAKELKEVRELRRQYKNEMAVVEEIKNNFVGRYDQQLSKVFESVTQKNDKLDQLTRDKIYMARIDENGEIAKVNSQRSKKLLRLQSKIKEQAV